LGVLSKAKNCHSGFRKTEHEEDGLDDDVWSEEHVRGIAFA